MTTTIWIILLVLNFVLIAIGINLEKTFRRRCESSGIGGFINKYPDTFSGIQMLLGCTFYMCLWELFKKNMSIAPIIGTLVLGLVMCSIIMGLTAAVGTVFEKMFKFSWHEIKCAYWNFLIHFRYWKEDFKYSRVDMTSRYVLIMISIVISIIVLIDMVKVVKITIF